MVSNNFERWALGFSGCDGGNPKGCVWLCGLEYGGDDTEDSLCFPDVSRPSAINPKDETFLRYQYNWRAMKLMAALKGVRPAEYREFFRRQSCFASDSDYFKLNLYPIAFNNTSHTRWASWLEKKTGFPTKQEYLTWCQTHRFRQLRRWGSEHAPRLIVCTGITHASEFCLAFGGKPESLRQAEASSKAIMYFTTNDDRTLVAVVYFFGGRYGLRSDEELFATGEALSDLVNNHTVPNNAFQPTHSRCALVRG